jgi:DMSO reductase anchor subunit
MTTGRNRRFDPAGDLPLVLFTSFAIMGAGVAGALPLLWIAAGSVHWPGDGITSGALALTGGGLLLSLLHLGRRTRAPLALAGVHRSPLSREVLLVTVLPASLAAALTGVPAIVEIARPTAVVTSLLLLTAIGLVYRLGGQVTWRGAAVPAPLILGLLWGVLLHASAATVPVEALSSVVYLLIALDVIVTESRWKRIEEMHSVGETRNREAFTRRRSHLKVRIVLVDLLGAGCFLLELPVIALIVVTAGVMIDRWFFYALGIQQNTVAEVRRVEAIIRKGRGG